jgi:predicted kinase
MVGFPGAGKTTWVTNQAFDPATTVIANADVYIEKYAREHNTTYNAVWKKIHKATTELFLQDVDRAINNNLDLVWDQANPTVGNRAYPLSYIPKHYRKIAVVISSPDREEHWRRLNSRPGREMSEKTFWSLAQSFTLPTVDEGFDEVRII